MFCDVELARAGWNGTVRQANHTFTRRRGTIRGMHFQYPPYGEQKLVTCVSGEVFDVAVDLRRASPTFLNWHAERLTADNHCSLLIPPGFAHGYQALCDEVQLLYFHSQPYQPNFEGGLHPADPLLGIEWPLPVGTISHRDASHPRLTLTHDFQGLEV
jgi:dTDP-4-dehydrorhamnose 3,5-epimerase